MTYINKLCILQTSQCVYQCVYTGEWVTTMKYDMNIYDVCVWVLPWTCGWSAPAWYMAKSSSNVFTDGTFMEGKRENDKTVINETLSQR